MFKKLVLIIILNLFSHIGLCQKEQNINTIELSLENAIKITSKESVYAQKHKETFMSSIWINESFKSDLLPQISLSISPFTFNRSIVKQFVPSDSQFDYFEQSILNSNLSLNVEQNLTFSGGRVFLKSDFARLENFGDAKSLAFSSAPILLGFNQPIFSFNALKWGKIMEKQRFQISKKEYISNMETTILETVNLFFQLLEKQLDLSLYKNNYINSKRLYNLGEKRFELTTLNKAEMLTLKMEMINSKNNVSKAKLSHKATMKRLLAHLDISGKSELQLFIPETIFLTHIDEEKALNLAKENNPSYLNQRNDELTAEMQLDKAKKDNGFRASVQASLGFNQRAESIDQFYNDLLDQQRINVSINIPIIDWKKRKSEIRVATHRKEIIKNNNIIERNTLEQEVIANTKIFNFQKNLLSDAKITSAMAQEVYEINRKRFLLGKLDVNNLIISQNRKDSAIRQYYKTLREYWQKYYLLRKLTLYDFKENRLLINDLTDF